MWKNDNKLYHIVMLQHNNMPPLFDDYHQPYDLPPPENIPFPKPIVYKNKVVFYLDGEVISLDEFVKIYDSLHQSIDEHGINHRLYQRLFTHLIQRQHLLYKIYQVQDQLKLDENSQLSQYHVLRSLKANDGDVINTIMEFL